MPPENNLPNGNDIKVNSVKGPQGFRSRQILIFLALGVLALGAGYWLGDFRHEQRTAGGADRLLDFSLPDSEGEMRTADDWHGRAILLNFWATWCAPCRDEIPELVEAQDEYGEQGLQVLGVALDNPEQVRRFMQEMSFNYPSLIAETEGMDIMAAYGNAGALPFTIAFDRDGRVVGKKLGRVSRSEIHEFAEAMLARQ